MGAGMVGQGWGDGEVGVWRKDQWMENYSKETSGANGRFCLNRPTRIFAGGRSR